MAAPGALASVPGVFGCLWRPLVRLGLRSSGVPPVHPDATAQARPVPPPALPRPPGPEACESDAQCRHARCDTALSSGRHPTLSRSSRQQRTTQQRTPCSWPPGATTRPR